MKFNKNKIKEITKKIEEIVMEIDPHCEVSAYIHGALQADSFDIVTRRLQIKIDFCNFEDK